MASFLVYAAACLLAALWYAAWFRRHSRPRSAPLPPGPTGLPLVGSIPFLEPDLHSYFARLARAHGPIFSLRLGAKLAVVVTSPSLAREVLKRPGRGLRQPRRPRRRARHRLRRRGRDRMEPQRARVAHAPPRMRPRDALPRRPRRRLRPPPPGGEGRGEKPPGARGQLRGRRRGDVPDGDERDHEHAVGRDAGGPGGAECGGEGVPGAGGGDNGAAGAAQCVGLLPGAGEVRPAGDSEADAHPVGALRSHLRVNHREEKKEIGGGGTQNARRRRLLGSHAKVGGGRWGRSDAVYHD
ncbi:cytochrome P450 [Musa troglodytarum]|uniref:Cytochrome P450 n=1 Tax=Musa troglodytarum TaxID=320322 RepID=A0A9E7GQ22_9LILI|nr:cytochrome P450 [Musa troglodytarum]